MPGGTASDDEPGLQSLQEVYRSPHGFAIACNELFLSACSTPRLHRFSGSTFISLSTTRKRPCGSLKHCGRMFRILSIRNSVFTFWRTPHDAPNLFGWIRTTPTRAPGGIQGILGPEGNCSCVRHRAPLVVKNRRPTSSPVR